MNETLSKDPKIWAGLNQPALNTKECEVAIFGIPYDGGVSFRSGAGEAPNALRGITHTIAPTTEDFESLADMKLVDIGDVEGASREAIFKKAEEITSRLVREGTFFIMIGGDHSVTIPVHRGIDAAVDEPFGIIHVDAHFDLCDSLNDNPLSHGSTARRALGLEHVQGIEDIFFLGIRSIEKEELTFYNTHPVQVVSAKKMSRIGLEGTIRRVKERLNQLNKIYITIDIDCLDPAYAAGTGTPQFGGLTSRDLLTLLEGLFELPIIGMDIVEVAPKLDSTLTAVFAARKLVMESCGFVHRKRKK